MYKENTIEIKNLRFDKMEHPYDVRVDRASVLGNPFKMFDESQRDLVCTRYYKYFYNKVNARDLKKNKTFIEEIQRLYSIYKKYGRLRLFCWCYPKRCHAETIKNFVLMIELGLADHAWYKE